MKLAWSNRAVQELRHLTRYAINRCGHAAALRSVQDMRDAAKHAAADPDAVRPLRGDMRIVHVRAHYLIVQVNAATSAVTIARVLHTPTDLGRNLP